MRTISVFNRVSLDGMYAGPNGEIDWFIHDPELDKDTFQGRKLGNLDTVLFGRLTYEMFESYWPLVREGKSPMGINTPVEHQIAETLTKMTKVVVTHQSREYSWENTKTLEGDLVPSVKKLKEIEGGGIIIFGSGTIVQALANAKLIDDYYIILTPVVLGNGKAQFADVKRQSLKLASIKSYETGNVLLHYKAD